MNVLKMTAMAGTVTLISWVQLWNKLQWCSLWCCPSRSTPWEILACTDNNNSRASKQLVILVWKALLYMRVELSE